MAITLILFFLYFFIGLWWLRRDGFVQRTGLRKREITLVFSIKCAVAVAYGYIGGPLYDYRFDTWTVFRESLVETAILKTSPRDFFTGFFGGADSLKEMWSNFQVTVHYKIMGIWNIFSGSRYYVNTVFYSFINFYGIVFFLRLIRLWKPVPVRATLWMFLLMPGFIFWSSGMYKEGWLFTGICAMTYGTVFLLKKNSYALPVLAGLVVLVCTRSFTAVLLVPGLLFFLIAGKRFPYFGAGLLLLFLSGAAFLQVSGQYDLVGALVARRNEYLALSGNSLLDPAALEPDWGSLLAYVPKALWLVLFRPYPSEGFSALMYFPAAVEVLLVQVILLFWLWSRGWKAEWPSIWKLLFIFSLIHIILIGLTVPFLGAIVRYRSIYLPFLLFPLLIHIWEKGINKLKGTGV